MVNPFVSVILPVYNGADYLSKAIESILSQSYKDFELIIINDGSSDNSLKIAQAYKDQDARIVLISQKNIGLVGTLNKGISLAKGQYIARMDQDDLSLENRFFEQVKLLELGYDLCGCHFHFINESGLLSKSRVVSVGVDFQAVILSRSTPFAHGSIMIRKSFLDDNNLRYSHDRYTSAEDYYLWVQCFERGAKITNVDEYLFLYRDFDLSLSKLNARNNIGDAISISRDFRIQNFKKIELSIESKLNSNASLNTFEQEQLAFFIFNTLFKRRILKTRYYLRFIALDVKLVAFFRSLKNFFKF
jgi:glycosyltransferase involved in cell wall biosynthesis